MPESLETVISRWRETFPLFKDRIEENARRNRQLAYENDDFNRGYDQGVLVGEARQHSRALSELEAAESTKTTDSRESRCRNL